MIVDKANVIYNEYTTSNNEIDHLQSILIDDTNTNMQIIFQHLERLLQIDLRSIIRNRQRISFCILYIRL